MSDESTVQVQKEPIRGRNDSAVKMFAGLAIGEIVAVLLILMLSLFLSRSGVVGLGSAFLAYAYFRYLKALVPENFFKNAWRYYTRKHYVYRAGARDHEWRPPIVPNQTQPR